MTLPGAASCESRATTAESTPPLSPTMKPRAPAAVICRRIHAAMRSLFDMEAL